MLAIAEPSMVFIGERYLPLLPTSGVAGGGIPTERVVVLDGEAAYEALELASKRWLDLGAPKRHEYEFEVWSKQYLKRRPKNGWLVQRDHSQLVFRLKRDGS